MKGSRYRDFPRRVVIHLEFVDVAFAAQDGSQPSATWCACAACIRSDVSREGAVRGGWVGGVVNLIRATYLRQSESNGCWMGETSIAITAECEQFGDELLVIWTDECLARLAALDLDAEELVGCTEAIEEAFFAAEREQCRVSKVRQQTGEVAA